MSVKIENIICPVCGDNQYIEEYAEKKLYVCAHELEPEVISKKVVLRSSCCYCQAYCTKCEQVLDQSEFGQHGDVYECKKCNTVNWPYTDYMRKQNEMKDTLKSILNRSRSVLDRFNY